MDLKQIARHFHRHLIAMLLLLSVCMSLRAERDKDTLRQRIRTIVEKLRSEKEVHFGNPVGFAGRRETNNKYYRKYLKLQKRASDRELLALTNDNSKEIVIYAVTILHSRQYTDLKAIFFEHQNDTAWYWTASGCTGVLNRVNWYMLRLLRPDQGSNSKNSMTKDEYNLYCDKFHKRDEVFTCN